MTERRRRRSRDVALVAVAGLAPAFTGCGGDEETAYCVDENDQVVENQFCGDESTGGGNRTSSGSTAAGPAAARRSRRAPSRAAAPRSSRPTSPRTHARRLRQQRDGSSGVGRPSAPAGAARVATIEAEPREGWPAIIEEQGLIYWRTELPDGAKISYWNEARPTTLSSDEVYELEASVRAADGDARRGRRLHHRAATSSRRWASPAGRCRASRRPGSPSRRCSTGASTSPTAPTAPSCSSTTPTRRPRCSRPPSSGTGCRTSSAPAATSGTWCTSCS